MDISQLIKSNRLPKTQRGQVIETPTAFYVRFYTDAPATEKDAKRLGVTIGTIIRKQVAEKVADRSDLYRSKEDVKPLIEQIMRRVNSNITAPTGRATLSEYITDVYLPWVQANKAAATHDGYRKLWAKNLAPHLGRIALADLTTVQVTRLLTKLAQDGLGRRTLTHTKWMLSGVYQHAVATGVVPKNPVSAAKWMKTVDAPAEQPRHTLEEVRAIMRILEPLDLRAAVAVGLAFYAALRPAEIRGLQWADLSDDLLHVRRKVWRKETGKLKTERSSDTVPLIEPLKSLLAKLREQSTDGFILQNSAGKPLDLDSLNNRVIAPALQKAGIAWHSYYACRRGMSSIVAEVSKNPLHSARFLRNSLAVNLTHYTDVSEDSILETGKKVEQRTKNETVQ